MKRVVPEGEEEMREGGMCVLGGGGQKGAGVDLPGSSPCQPRPEAQAVPGAPRSILWKEFLCPPLPATEAIKTDTNCSDKFPGPSQQAFGSQAEGC